MYICGYFGSQPHQNTIHVNSEGHCRCSNKQQSSFVCFIICHTSNVDILQTRDFYADIRCKQMCNITHCINSFIWKSRNMTFFYKVCGQMHMYKQTDGWTNMYLKQYAPLPLASKAQESNQQECFTNRKLRLEAC